MNQSYKWAVVGMLCFMAIALRAIISLVGTGLQVVGIAVLVRRDVAGLTVPPVFE